MLLSTLSGSGPPKATRGDYVRDWLSGLDVDDAMRLSDAGIPIMPEAALRVAVIYRAVNVLAHAVASIPLVIYKHLPDGGKELAQQHPSYKLLHDAPNAWSTSFRWRHLVMTRMILWGNSYNQLLPGLGAIGQIVPLEPSTTRVVDQLANGKLLYVTKDITQAGYGPERRLLQDEVLHLRGFSLDGKRGCPLADVARNAIGLALSAERHGSMFLRKGARFSGILVTPGQIEENERKDNEASWQRAYGGSDASGLVPVLSGGLDFKAIQANNRDSQWLEARTFQVEELLRFIGVPGVLCGYADKTATYASAEQFFLSFVTHTVHPATENFAQELNLSVITEPDTYYAAFVTDGLLRGDIKTRYASAQMAILSGWKSRNDVRREEGMNPGPPELDEFLEPMNTMAAGSAPEEAAEGDTAPPQPQPPPPPTDPTNEAKREQLEKVLRVAAVRVVRREISRIVGAPGQVGAAKRYAKDQEGWRRWLEQFYAEQVEFVAETLGVSRSSALAYCDEQRRAILVGGVKTTETWEQERVPALVAMILEEWRHER